MSTCSAFNLLVQSGCYLFTVVGLQSGLVAIIFGLVQSAWSTVVVDSALVVSVGSSWLVVSKRPTS